MDGWSFKAKLRMSLVLSTCMEDLTDLIAHLGQNLLLKHLIVSLLEAKRDHGIMMIFGI